MELKVAGRARAKCAHRQNEKMGDRKSGGLLWKRERKFPNENDGRVYKKRERSVLKFTGEIAAHPRVRAQDRPMALRPTARHVGKYWQHGQFIIVIPKNERIVPKKKQAERDDDKTG